MDTQYYHKSVDIEKQLDKIEILSLGASNGYFDLNPDYFPLYGYNLAFNNQSPFYDYQLLIKYIDRMPKLKLVILPAIFYTMGTDLPNMSQNWRMYFYRLYFGLPLESDANTTVPYDLIVEPRSFSRIALYGSHTYDYIEHNYHDQVDYHPESNGWFNSETSEPAPIRPMKLGNKMGETIAAIHSDEVDVSMFTRNLGYWQRIVDLLKKRNIQVIVVRLPAHETYYNNLNPEKLSRFLDALTDFIARNHIAYADYTKDARFTVEDYTFMIDHLNKSGAAKFTTIFDREQIEPLLKGKK